MSVWETTVTAMGGTPVPFSNYRGQVLLVVNTASLCGFTPQYDGLETLYKTYHDRGFAVLGFPCNQFGEQDPGTNQEIQAFCRTRFGVSFPLFEKVDVKGPTAHPLFSALIKEQPGTNPAGPDIAWNFTKFLIDREGRVVARFEPNVEPKDLAAEIEKRLARPA